MKKQNITLSLALAAVFTASTAFAEAEVTGKIVHESAKFTSSGTTIGAAAAHDKDYYKQETSARIFIDGDASDNAAFHIELQAFKDGKAGTNYDGNDAYTQRDALREAYIDTEINGISIRAGKQQVVWGTADGMKLLDAINPTDFSEMAQNQMEDSRIPVWMINAEKTLEDGGVAQLILSESKANVIAGLTTTTSGTTYESDPTRNMCGLVNGGVGATCNGFVATAGSTDHSGIVGTDQGQAFIMKGVDSISGKYNGMLNIVPELAEVAHTFGQLSAGFAGSNDNAGYHLQNWTYASVNQFVTNTGAGSAFGGACPYYGINTADGAQSPSSAYCLNAIAQDTNESATNLIDSSALPTAGVVLQTDATPTTAGMSGPEGSDAADSYYKGQGMGGEVTGDWDSVTPTSAFEYMVDAAFGTFATFSNASSKYNRVESTTVNTGLRYSNVTPSGVNYSLNYTSQADTNPYVDMEWQNAAGDTLEVVKQTDPSGYATGMTTIRVTDAGGVWHTGDGFTPKYGYDGSGAGVNARPSITNPVVLVMTEKYADIANIGGSFDTSIESASLGPVVLRGEFMYQKDTMQPIVNKAEMKIGNITEALTSIKADRVKFVLGADITVMTNMMISAQIIQDRNLDFVDETVTVGETTDARYTGDMATMHMSNQFNKAEENKEFYSLFFSKPFGASGEHRWNNIFMFEENGGKWNRLDAEFSINDETQVTVEYNKYWGNENTQFGQLEASSNIQAGFKYSF